MADTNFTFVKPVTTRVQTALEFFQDSFQSLAGDLRTLPEGRERALALTKLEEAWQWAASGVLRNQGHWSPDLGPST